MTDVDPVAAPERGRKRRKDSRYPEQVEAFLRRFAAGETVAALCRDPEMPAWSSLQRWLASEPGFSERFVEARAAGKAHRSRGRPTSFDEAAAHDLCERIALGEPLTRLCQEPGMPSVGAVFGWLKRYPAFREAYGIAREVQAHVLADQITELLDEAEPGTATLVKLKADHLRWQAGRLAPTVFGTATKAKAKAADDDDDDEEVLRVVLKSFAPGEIVRLDLVSLTERNGTRFETYREVREVKDPGGTG